MFTRARYSAAAALLLAAALVLVPTPAARAYVEQPHSLGQILNLSTNIVVMRVDSVDRAKNLIVYAKVRDLKGTHNTQVIRHNIGKAGFHPREWQYVMEWAEVGKTAVFFHNGGASETCIGNYWYQAYPGGEWWNHSHGEPFLLRSFCGGTDKLIAAVTAMQAGQETVVPCMVDNKDDLHLRRGRIQRVKASLKLDYNPKRDFVGWGGEDFRRVEGMPGFTHVSSLPRVDPDARSLSVVDLDNDGRLDLCLGGSRVAVMQNGGEAVSELGVPVAGAGRAAVWADYNADGLPDLFAATTAGPKLFTNTGGGGFRDDTHLLPREPGYHLTAAAWLDQDGDGRPDLLLGNGFHGLRLYRNGGPTDVDARPLKLSEWRYIGPFPNGGGQGFGTAFPPEKEVDYAKKYPGRGGEEAAWKEGKFKDGEASSFLGLFKPENSGDGVIYLHRTIEVSGPTDLPISLGSDDTLTVWLDGKKIHSENVQRGVAPDQARLTLKLEKGRHDLLLKICQGGGEWGFYFKADKEVPKAVTWKFADVSDEVGLGSAGLGSAARGDTLTVADVDGDGRPDFLYGAGGGLLARNTGAKFVEAKEHGIACTFGRVGPAFADFDRDGHADLLVPQPEGVKLFRNDGTGRFADVTAASGLGSFRGQATSAAWGDVDNDGHLDLVVGVLRGPNRFFKNKGDGTFADATEAIGLHGRIFNTQAVALADINRDGTLDFVFNNEGQDPCVLLGNPAFAPGRTPVTVQVAGKTGVVGSRVRVLDKDGKLAGVAHVSGGDGRGGQAAPVARFALAPGSYRVEVLDSAGKKRVKDVTVAEAHVRAVVDETATRAD